MSSSLAPSSVFFIFISRLLVKLAASFSTLVILKSNELDLVHRSLSRAFVCSCCFVLAVRCNKCFLVEIVLPVVHARYNQTNVNTYLKNEAIQNLDANLIFQ